MDNSNKAIILSEAAKLLIEQNGSTTTLDLKNYVRLVFPSTTWTQEEVSTMMDSFYKNQSILGLSYTYNGTYRKYYTELNTKTVSSTVSSTVTTKDTKTKKKVQSKKVSSKKVAKKKVSRSAAVEMIKETKGKFFGVTFIKTDGSERTLNCHVSSKDFMDNTGYIRCTTSKGEIKRINPRTLISVSVGGVLTKVKP